MTPGTLQRKSTSALADRVLMQASDIAWLHAKLRHVIAFFGSRVQDTEFYAILNFGVWQIVAVKMQRLLKLFFRSEEHTSELQSLMRISYAVFCLKKNKRNRL